MNNKIKIVVKNILSFWGAISLIGIITILGYLSYSLTFGNKPKVNKAEKSDVKFILNWSGLGDQRIKNVTNSYQSGRSFGGDYLDAYAIEITNVNHEELKIENGFYRLDSLPPILDDAVKMVNNFQYEIRWFPELDKVQKDHIYVYPWSIYYNGITPIGAELIFVVPKDKKVYFIGTKN